MKTIWRNIDNYDKQMQEYHNYHKKYSNKEETIKNYFLRDSTGHYAKAVDLICSAIERKMPIFISGDYDVDGMTSVAILYRGISEIYEDVQWWVPDRTTNGYGLDISVIASKVSKTPALIIAVDTGITEVDKCITLISRGYQILILDHHIPDMNNLPDADVIVDPKCFADQTDTDYHACGGVIAAKVMYQLKCRYCNNTDVPINHATMELAALCILSDVIPLTDEMKVLLEYGMICLRTSDTPGIQALFIACGIKENTPVTSHLLVFTVIPKLNAAGRMGVSSLGVKLFLSSTNVAYLAQNLVKLNSTRKEIENLIFTEALQLASEYVKVYPHSVVVYKSGWHSGVLGIVAARLLREFCVPVIVLTQEGDSLHGSCRSVEGCNIYNILQDCSDLLEQFGGHAAAAGLSLKADMLPEFKKQFEASIVEQGIPEQKVLEYSKLITIEDCQNIPWILSLRMKEPTGNQNLNWIFRVEEATVVYVSNIAINNNAVTVVLRNDAGNELRLRQFRPVEDFSIYLYHKVHTLISPDFVYFGGITRPEWQLVDIQEVPDMEVV